MDMEVIPGGTTDPSLLGFSYVIEEKSSTHMDIKFNFEKPLEIS